MTLVDTDNGSDDRTIHQAGDGLFKSRSKNGERESHQERKSQRERENEDTENG